MSGGHQGRFSRDSLSVLSARGHCEQFLHGQGCPFFDVVHPAFSLPASASPTLQGALKDGFGEAVVACEMTTLSRGNVNSESVKPHCCYLLPCFGYPLYLK